MSEVDIRREWRRHVVSPWSWRAAENTAGVLGDVRHGEAGGLFVTSEALGGRRAYMKPRKKDDGIARAAREKIAADLAFDLDVNVPPVMLYVRDDAANEERFVCVSLVMFPRQWSWGQVKTCVADPSASSSGELVVAKLSTAASSAFALDTWLGQTDHGDHPHNVVFGYDPSDLEGSSCFVFLDFSFSMGSHQKWTEENRTKCEEARFPPLMIQRLDPDRLGETIGRIEGYDEGLIREIVDRIPKSHLRAEDAEFISAGLIERRSLIRNALEKYLGSAQ